MKLSMAMWACAIGKLTKDVENVFEWGEYIYSNKEVGCDIIYILGWVDELVKEWTTGTCKARKEANHMWEIPS